MLINIIRGRQWSFFIILLFISFIYATPSAFAISAVTGSAATSTISEAGAITDVRIVGADASTTPVKLVVSNGSLAFGVTTGLTFTGGTTGSTLTFSGTVANINAALATLTYTRGSIGTDTLEVSLIGASEVFFPGNGHLYEYIAGAIDWNAALAAAAGQTRYGATGYLTTITSASENNFVADRLSDAGWMGASDAGAEGDWSWRAGPEINISFWSGDENGSTTVPYYANWEAFAEPNNAGNLEHCAQFLSGGSGIWNDLNCGDTLSGYVVEFGQPGGLPTVIANNFALQTINAPVVTTFVPADNATAVSPTANLQLTFNVPVTVATGSITIHLASDNSVVETIPVNSGQVTGSGTTVITINPNTTLADSTAYYVQVASTSLRSAGNTLFAGINNSTTWNFSTNDLNGPVFSNIVSTPERTTATITWNTNELASTQVVYGETISTDTNTTETNTAPRVSTHSVSLTDLTSCTEYNFRLVGSDTAGNRATSTLQTFSTPGCSSGSSGNRPTNRTPSGVSAPAVVSGSNRAELEKQLGDLLAQFKSLTGKDFSASASPVIVLANRTDLTVRDLARGMQGEDVKALQTILIAQGYEIGAGPTGFFASQTKTALAKYQTEKGIVPAAGYFGSITRVQMKTAGMTGLWW